jgi:hypothetical protein
MNAHTNITPAQLVYNGAAIRDRDNTLSLTDMWKAAGSEPSKRPVEWLRSEHAQRFINFMAEDLGMGEVGKSHFGLVTVSKGGSAGGATYAHWQIAFAYAKYLSPEFHMWCNKVARERMEGAPRNSTGLVTDLAAEVRNAIGGIVKGIVHKEMTETIPALVAAKLAEQNLGVTDGVTAGEVCGLSKVATNYPKGIARRVSVRLSLFCARNGEKPRVSRLGRVRAQVFPTHLVREWLDIEGRGLIKSWVAESLGQKHLRLVGGSAGISGEAQARGQA